METLMRSWERREVRAFAVCVVISAVLHGVLAWLALPGGSSGQDAVETTRLAERFGSAVNAATELDPRERARIESLVTKLDATRWSRAEMGDTLQWLADDLGLAVKGSDLVRALDPERAREGRWDIRVFLDWAEGRGAGDLLELAYLTGEGTLKSDFGSHRLWVHLEAPDGSGRVAFETMDCRLYRAGKLGATDLLHRSGWHP